MDQRFHNRNQHQPLCSRISHRTPMGQRFHNRNQHQPLWSRIDCRNPMAPADHSHNPDLCMVAVLVELVLDR